MTCNDCGRMFKSQQCFDQNKHRRGDSRSVFEAFIRCDECGKIVRVCMERVERHECGQRECGVCGKYVQIEGHHCFIQPETKKRRRKRSEEEQESNGFFNTECREGNGEENDDEPIEEKNLTELCSQENGTHVPNLRIVQNEAGNEWIFQGDTTQRDFCE